MLLVEAARNPHIRVVVTDSAYGNLRPILNAQLTKESGLPSCFNPGITWAAQKCYGIRPNELDPIRVASEWGSRPLLIIHGEDDHVVPLSQAEDLERAIGSSARLVTWKGAGHVEAYERSPEEYIRTVGEFFQQHLSP